MGISRDAIDIGVKITAEGQAIVSAVNSVLAAMRQQLGLLTQQVNVSNAAARQQRSGFQGVQQQLAQLAAQLGSTTSAQRSHTSAMQQGAGAASSMGSNLKTLVEAVIALRIIREVASEISDFVRGGVAFNSMIEGATLGIASLITLQAELRTSSGQLLTGTEALNAAEVIAGDQLDKLRAAGLRTHATMQDLIPAFQQATGSALRWGLTLDQAREFTVGMVQAAFALQLPLNQLNEEVRDLLAGNITPRNTRIATALGITNEQIKQAQKAGTLFDFVKSKLDAFSVAGERNAQTLVGLTSNARQFFEVFAGAATKPLFDDLKESIGKALQNAFDLDRATIAPQFEGIVDVAREVFGGIGELLKDAIEGAVQGAEEFNNWLRANAAEIANIENSLRAAGDAVRSLAGDTAGVLTALTGAAVEAGVLATVLVGAGEVAALIHTTVQALGVLLGGIASLIITGIVGGFGLTAQIIGKIVALTNKPLGDALQNVGRSAIEFVKKIDASYLDFTRTLDENGTALDQYLARVQKIPEQNERAARDRSLRDKLRADTQSIKDAQRQQEEALSATLKARQITREQYETRLNAIRLDSVKKEQAAVVEAHRLTTSPDERRTLEQQITRLQQQRELLEKGVSVVARPAPLDTAELKRQQSDAEKLAHAVAEAAIRDAKAIEQSKIATLKASLEQQTISYDDFYDRLSGLQAASVDAQIAALNKELQVVKDPAKIEAIKGQIRTLSDSIAGIFEENDTKAREANKRLDDAVLQATVSTLRAQGQFVAAARADMTSEFEKTLAMLKLRGDTNGVAALEAQKAQILIHAQFQELSSSSSKVLDRMNAELEQTSTLAKSHAITESEARERVIATYDRAREALAKLLPLFDAIEGKLTDEGDLNAVKRLRQQYLDLGVSLAQTRDRLFALKEAGRESATSALAGVLEGATRLGTESRSEISALTTQLQGAQRELDALLNVPAERRTTDQAQRITELRSEIEQTSVSLDNAKRSITGWRDLFVEALKTVLDSLVKVAAQAVATSGIDKLFSLFGKKNDQSASVAAAAGSLTAAAVATNTAGGSIATGAGALTISAHAVDTSGAVILAAARQLSAAAAELAGAAAALAAANASKGTSDLVDEILPIVGDFASGGRITRGTTPTADDVLIRASRDETINPAASNYYYGFDVAEAFRRRLLPRDAIRALMNGYKLSGLRPRSGITRFAEGGVVTQPISLSGAGSNTLHEVRLRVAPELIVEQMRQFMRGEGGRDGVLTILRDNSNAVQTLVNH